MNMIISKMNNYIALQTFLLHTMIQDDAFCYYLKKVQKYWHMSRH